MQKISDIEDRLTELTRLRDKLAHLASACHGDNRPDCPILDAFSANNLAGRGNGDASKTRTKAPRDIIGVIFMTDGLGGAPTLLVEVR